MSRVVGMDNWGHHYHNAGVASVALIGISDVGSIGGLRIGRGKTTHISCRRVGRLVVP